MKTIWIICEGKTEFAYIQEFNKYLREQGFQVNIIAKDLGGITVTNWTGKIRQVLKNNKFPKDIEIYAWIDFDIFKRKNISKDFLSKKLNKVIKKDIALLLNYMNGEDFLVMHLSETLVKKWASACNDNKHFENPMLSNIVIETLKELQLFNNYKKGDFPFSNNEFPQNLDNLFNNQNNPRIMFKSDLVKILMNLLD